MRGVRCLLFGALAVAFALLPLSASAASPALSPSPSPSPSPHPTPTPPPSPTPTALPTPQGQLSVSPPSAPPSTRVTLHGQGFPANQSFQVLFDGNALDTAFTDGSGSFSRDIAVPDTATGAGHQICVDEPGLGRVCANFTLEAPPPSPTLAPSPLPTPSPSPSPSASGAASTAGGGITPLGALTRPPFVFFPIALVLAAMAGFSWWLWSMRPGPEIGEVIVEHTAVPPRAYEPAAPSEPVAAEAPPPPPVLYESPSDASPAPAPQPRPAPPSSADIPPDLPEASD